MKTLKPRPEIIDSLTPRSAEWILLLVAIIRKSGFKGLIHVVYPVLFSISIALDSKDETS